MAETEITVPLQVDDKELFQSAMADEPRQVEQEQPPEPRADATGRLHGQDGRYVNKPAQDAGAAPTQQPPETPVPQQTEQRDDGANVPSWRLREVREAREAAERRAQELERN